MEEIIPHTTTVYSHTQCMLEMLFLQSGLQGLKVCDHLQTVFTALADHGKITLSTSGPPEHDQSLLNHPEFWDVVTVQQVSGIQYRQSFIPVCIFQFHMIPP